MPREMKKFIFTNRKQFNHLCLFIPGGKWHSKLWPEWLHQTQSSDCCLTPLYIFQRITWWWPHYTWNSGMVNLFEGCWPDIPLITHYVQYSPGSTELRTRCEQQWEIWEMWLWKIGCGEDPPKSAFKKIRCVWTTYMLLSNNFNHWASISTSHNLTNDDTHRIWADYELIIVNLCRTVFILILLL